VVADQVGKTLCVFLIGLHRAERTIAEGLMRLAPSKDEIIAQALLRLDDGQFELRPLQPRASPVEIATAVVVDSALRRRYPVSCALQVGNGVLPRRRPRAFLARSLRRPPGARMAALSGFPVAIVPLRLSQRIPPIKHIRRGFVSGVALILEVHGAEPTTARRRLRAEREA
jgi:hypothetical protein